MSFIQDLKAFYRRAKGIVRARAYADEDLKKQIEETGHGVDLTNKDQVIVSLADNTFEKIYPTPNSIKVCNDVSIPTAVTSVTSNLSFLASAALGVYFFTNAMYGVGHVFGGEMALMAYLSSFATNLTIVGSAFTLGSLLRKADRDLTMNLCLDSAQAAVEANKQLYYDTALQIEMDTITASRDGEIESHQKLRDLLQKEADTFHYMIEDLKKSEGGDEALRQRSIISLTEKQDALLARCLQLDEQIGAIEEKAEKIAGNARIKHILARALPAAETIEDLKTGQLDKDIERLGEDAREQLLLIASTTKSRRDELMIRIGLEDRGSEPVLELESDDNTVPKPLLLEAGEKDDGDKPLVIDEDEQDKDPSKLD